MTNLPDSRHITQTEVDALTGLRTIQGFPMAFHPMTCGNDSRHELVREGDELVCPVEGCGYRQDTRPRQPVFHPSHLQAVQVIEAQLSIAKPRKCKSCAGQGLCLSCRTGDEIKAERDNLRELMKVNDAENQQITKDIVALRESRTALKAENEEMRKVLGECLPQVELAKRLAEAWNSTDDEEKAIGTLIQRIKALTEGKG